jgi:hypothetical protein
MRWLAALGLVLALGCAPATTQTAKPRQPQNGGASARGEALRVRATVGDTIRARVKLVLELESGRPGRTLTHTFNCTGEERVDAVEPDGAAQVSARMLDVVGTSTDQHATDEMALALDELKIQFKRSPRGDVAALAAAGVRSPLDDRIARSVVNALYGGARGPMFPEPKIEPGATWKVQTPQWLTPYGIVADGTYNYLYLRKEGQVAVVTGTGTLEGRAEAGGQTRHLSGRTSSEWRLSLDGGRLRYALVEITTDLDENPAVPRSAAAGHQRVLVEWTLAGPSSGAAEGPHAGGNSP